MWATILWILSPHIDIYISGIIHPFAHSFNKYHQISMGRALPPWARHPPLFFSADSLLLHPAWCGVVLPSQPQLNLTVQPFLPSDRYSDFSGQGYPEPWQIFVMWKMEINRFSSRKEGLFVFTGPKFMRGLAMWGYRDQEDWNVYTVRKRKLSKNLSGTRNFEICFYK